MGFCLLLWGSKTKALFSSPTVTLTKANAGSLGNDSSVYLVWVMAAWTFSSVHTLAESPAWAFPVLPLGISNPTGAHPWAPAQLCSGHSSLWVLHTPAHKGLFGDLPWLLLRAHTLIWIHKQLRWTRGFWSKSSNFCSQLQIFFVLDQVKLMTH